VSRDEVLSFTTANLWRENKRPGHDIRLLCKQGTTSVGLNEARKFHQMIDRIARSNGYDAFGTAPGNKGNNPVLLQDDIKVIDVERRTISEEVGISPARTALCVKFKIDKRKYAHINTHFNSHVQEGPANPHELARVGEYIDGIKEVTRWVNRLRKQGFYVVVTGDMNWAYRRRSLKNWWWSPQRAFRRRSGLVCQFDYRVLKRPKGDRRPIEYVLWHPDDFKFRGQHFIRGEHSDHPFHEVTLQPRPKRRQP
jgi:hypothetical protein